MRDPVSAVVAEIIEIVIRNFPKLMEVSNDLSNCEATFSISEISRSPTP